MYEFVILNWNGIEYPTRIVQCWFRLDSREWWYQIAQVSNEFDDERFFPESVLESRQTHFQGDVA